jgi:hypothetical protein
MECDKKAAAGENLISFIEPCPSELVADPTDRMLVDEWVLFVLSSEMCPVMPGTYANAVLFIPVSIDMVDISTGRMKDGGGARSSPIVLIFL